MPVVAVNFPRRLRQHNGEIAGGAKYTRKGGLWTPIWLVGRTKEMINPVLSTC